MAKATKHHTCPGCHARSVYRAYLCSACWKALPLSTRRALTVRDDLAFARYRELLEKLADGVPLTWIEVA